MYCAALNMVIVLALLSPQRHPSGQTSLHKLYPGRSCYCACMPSCAPSEYPQWGSELLQSQGSAPVLNNTGGIVLSYIQHLALTNLESLQLRVPSWSATATGVLLLLALGPDSAAKEAAIPSSAVNLHYCFMETRGMHAGACSWRG